MFGIHVLLRCYTNLSFSCFLKPAYPKGRQTRLLIVTEATVLSGYHNFVHAVFLTGVTPHIFSIVQIIQKLLFKFYLIGLVCTMPGLFLLWIFKGNMVSMSFIWQLIMDHSGFLLLHHLVLLLNLFLCEYVESSWR